MNSVKLDRVTAWERRIGQHTAHTSSWNREVPACLPPLAVQCKNGVMWVSGPAWRKVGRSSQ